MFKPKAIALALAMTTSIFASASFAAQPSVVIVHGAFADGSDWAKVVPLLQTQGIKVTVVQNPLTSLADDVAATQRVLNNQDGNVVLVGHSWGGTVISQAGTDQKVRGLVYVAAFAPDAGQASKDLGKDYPAPAGVKDITADKNGFLYMTAQGMATGFAQDLPAEQTAVMAATQGPIRASAFDDKTSAAAWKGKPSWYVVARDDRMIQPDLQRAFAKKIGAQVTEIQASHVPQQSRPADVAKVIIQAVQQSQ
ncbi:MULTISPECIES: alpha/beta hydrolase [Pseudomonas]|uniref:Alpha/beta hydrolase n=1 Tax=Pseudomonas azadiae TaxID=2843612 RepID=A0ABS6NU25_9PSED|nr:MULTISPECIES: alpha/beta hydrolase [Pseudomonas]MBV4451665.1 alpha/beta hydrolase [Pseudomonas azadiae]NMF39473.1 alpha/beta hydrolase [Pseudomonas sp. SWRI 103]